jgi:phosphate uptake regulator
MSGGKPGNRDVRKLQITGGSTYILSLPKQWVSQMALEKGSAVSLIQQDDGSILLLPESSIQVDKPTEAIILSESMEAPDLVIRKVISAYLVGYNVIIVRAKKDRLVFSLRNAVKEFTRRKLVGTEIIADSPSEVVLKVLLSYPELSMESALRRMCIITASMHRDAMTALRERSTDLAREVIYMDDEVDRFSFYIIRQLKAAIEDPHVLNEIGVVTRRNCLGYRLITKAVERTADHAVKIAENVLTLKKPVEPEVLQPIEAMSTAAITLFNGTIQALHSQDFHVANQIVHDAKQAASLRNELMERLLKRTDVEEVSSLSLIIESVTRVAEYASDIAEIVLNLNIVQNLP